MATASSSWLFGVVQLQRGDLGVADVAGDVAAVEATGLEALQARLQRGHDALHRVEVLVDQRIGADVWRISSLLRSAAISSARGRHVDAVDVGEAHRRRGRRQIDLAGTGFARHLHDLLGWWCRARWSHRPAARAALELLAMALSFCRTDFLRTACPGMMKVRPT
jgi:hypothetical protein